MRAAARVAAAALVATFILVAAQGAAADDHAPPVSRETVQRAIDGAAWYLMRATRLDGSFEYRVNPNPAVTVKPRYNMLRHAGSIYAMTMYLAEQENAAVEDAALQAARYLMNRTVEHVAEEEAEDLLAVWSSPELTNSKKPVQAKLGGAGLGLVALAGLEDVRPGFTRMEDLRALGRFILFMQKPDGSFYSKYIPSTGGGDDSWTSLYYPGEAALGLLMLFELDPDRVWLDAAGGALEFLALSRAGQNDVPADHWALLATAKLLALAGDRIDAERRARLIAHAVQICTAILEQQIVGPGYGPVEGSFNPQGRVTPTATRLEGLLAARTFLPDGSDLARDVDAAVARGIAFLLRAQIVEGHLAGGFPRAIAPLPDAAPKADSFNRRATEVRIDYVQHALSALIQYRAAVRFR